MTFSRFFPKLYFFQIFLQRFFLGFPGHFFQSFLEDFHQKFLRKFLLGVFTESHQGYLNIEFPTYILPAICFFQKSICVFSISSQNSSIYSFCDSKLHLRQLDFNSFRVLPEIPLGIQPVILQPIFHIALQNSFFSFL